MTSGRRTTWSLFCALLWGLLPSVGSAHPVPSGAHLRAIEVRPRPNELCVYYRLEVDQFTTVYVDSKGLIDDAELKRLKTPSEFYEVYTRRLAPLLADQLAASLNDKPLTLRCVEHRFEVLDHLRCDFIFQADWAPAPGVEHELEFHDPTYDREPGRVKLSLSEDAAVSIVRRTVPRSLLQSRAPPDLRPGDDDRLRTVRASFRLAEPTAPAASAPAATPAPAPPLATGNAHSTLLALLDAPHGFGVLLLLAAA